MAFPPGASASPASPPKASSGASRCCCSSRRPIMNESGRAVGEAVRFYKLDLADVIVFHDELDLVPGKVRVKTGGGVAGHNGLRSLTAHLGNDYVRVRIGIGHPGAQGAGDGLRAARISPSRTATGSSLCSAPSPRQRLISPKAPTTSFSPSSLTPCISKPRLPRSGPSPRRASARMRRAPASEKPAPPREPSASFAAGSAS